MKTKTLWITVGVICAAVALWLIFRPTGKQTVTLETARAERIDISNSVTATGTVEPVTKVEVGTQVSASSTDSTPTTTTSSRPVRSSRRWTR